MSNPIDDLFGEKPKHIPKARDKNIIKFTDGDMDLILTALIDKMRAFEINIKRFINKRINDGMSEEAIKEELLLSKNYREKVRIKTLLTKIRS